ncbi:unnamed protein product [Cylindrotheca closterium]|uniref:PH domain-containing protein n=1 Tax=Cylindrotheca closterium TaxID=2856 RepID=A0AAD2JLB5_9STRA|nr:unnamed protein product [Cylindrotheca closterium]
MSAMEHLAAPAPEVEVAEADRAIPSASFEVAPVTPCEDASVQSVRSVEPAMTVDDPKKLAPPMSKEEASHLSVKALRRSGIEFESKAAVIQGGVKKDIFRKCLPLFFDERDFVSYGEVVRYMFIKNNCILVYTDDTSPFPLYAIQISDVTVEQEDPRKPDKYSFTVSPQPNTNKPAENMLTFILRDKVKRKIAYQVTFDTTNDKSLGKMFMDLFQRNAKKYGDEVITASVVGSNSKIAKNPKP